MKINVFFSSVPPVLVRLAHNLFWVHPAFCAVIPSEKEDGSDSTERSLARKLRIAGITCCGRLENYCTDDIAWEEFRSSLLGASQLIVFGFVFARVSIGSDRRKGASKMCLKNRTGFLLRNLYVDLF